jgi:FtsH-binding integral membrane protein
MIGTQQEKGCNMTNEAMTIAQVEVEQRSFFAKVYGWMTLALAITALVASFVAGTPALVKAIVTNEILFYGLLIAELALVAGLSAWIGKMSGTVATLVFIFYSALNGLTLSVIFLIFTAASLGITFLVTAGTFGITAVYGYLTKSDLSSIGNIAFMGLIGFLLASVVNLWMESSAVYWITTYVGIAVFVGLTAYDTQKIKRMNVIGNAGTDEDRKEAIMGALALYLDFINLFLLLLRFFGRRR